MNSVKAESFSCDSVTKLTDISNGVKQVNRQLRLGLFRNYLCVVIVVEGSERTQQNHLGRGATQDQFQRVYELSGSQGLDPSVGVLFMEAVQPTGKDFFEAGFFAIALDRWAQTRDQSSSTTRKVAALVREFERGSD